MIPPFAKNSNFVIMNPQNEGMSSVPAKPAKTAKRKRGRPRKEDGSSRGKIPTVLLPESSGARSRQLREAPPSHKTADLMVGQQVSGVVEASFGAGHLLTVRVGEMDTLLRGVVFQPGCFTPISETNDVAPNARMYKRRNVPLSASNALNRSNNARPSHLEKRAPVTPILGPFKFLPIAVSLGTPVILQKPMEPPSDPSLIVKTDNLPKNDLGLLLGGSAVPEVVVQEVSQLDYNRAVEKCDVMQDLRGSPLKEGPSKDIERSKNLNLDTSSKALTEEHDGAESEMEVTKNPNLDSMPNPVIELVEAVSKMSNLEIQLTPIVEKKDFPENVPPLQDNMQLELPGEIPERIKTCENGKKVMIMQEEAALFQPEMQAGGSDLLVMGNFDSKIPCSSEAIGNTDCASTAHSQDGNGDCIGN